FTFPRNNNLPRYRNQNVYSFHDDFTLSYDARGRHDLKMGGEYLHLLDDTRNCNQCGGVITANQFPRPANLASLFPDPFNADTWNGFAQDATFPPFEMPGRPQDKNNIQPRVGFAYQLNDRTVVRGGTGLYYNDILNTNVLWPMSPQTIAVIAVNNDGRADFAA